jgi:transposase
MSQSHTRFIGMDVHTDAIAVASVAQAHGAEVTDLGAIGTRQWDIEHLVRKRPSQATQLLVISAAGPGGYWLSRDLLTQGYDCWVVAPSLMPTQPGDRVTTDRRDALHLARLARSGDLTVGSVAKVDEAAMRDLPRAREDAISDLQDATCRLQAFLRRHASRSVGRANWSPAPLRGLSEGVCPPPAQPSVLQDDLRAVSAHSDRLQRLAQARHDHVTTWRLSPVVEALQALRGVPCTVAVPLVAAMGDLPRFEKPRELMQCRGLLPSEHASGAQRRQGSMTQAGTTHARRVLVAGAWASRSPAKGRRHRQRRREQQPTVLQDISWQAQGRLWKRSRRLVSRGTHAHGVTVAIARELSGFLWAMAQEVPLAG